MLKIYCSNCGSPTEYSLKKPSFCSSCGNSFFNSVSHQKIIRPISKNIKSLEQEEDFDNDQDINNVPAINKLDFDINFEKNPVEKISDLASSAKDNPYREPGFFVDNHSAKNILEEFAKEAGAIRPKQRSRKTKNANQKKSEI